MYLALTWLKPINHITEVEIYFSYIGIFETDQVITIQTELIRTDDIEMGT